MYYVFNWSHPSQGTVIMPGLAWQSNQCQMWNTSPHGVVQRGPGYLQNMILVAHQNLTVKTLLMKIPHIWVTGQGEIKLALTRNFSIP